MQNLYRRFRSLFVYADLYIRLAANPRVRRKREVFWGYAKLRFLHDFRQGYRESVRLFGKDIEYGTLKFLWYTFREVFIERWYAMHAPPTASRIIDGGANIGLAALYYKQTYPGCQIVCFEPDPNNFRLLKQNLEGLEGIELHEAALAPEDGSLSLYLQADSPGDTGSSASQELREAAEGADHLAPVSVKAVSLKRFLKEPVDILKLDIEGNEVSVLESIKEDLPRVSCIQLEYHYLSDNKLEDLLRIFEEAGHRYLIESREPVRNEPGSVAMIYSTRSGGG